MTAYVVRVIEYLLGVDDKGAVLLSGPSPLRKAIRSLLTGKEGPLRPYRGTLPSEMLELKVKVPADHFARGRFIIDFDRINEVQEIAVSHFMQELYLNKLQGAIKGVTQKQVIYDFMERLDCVDQHGLNYQMLKRKLNRFESAQRHARRSNTPSRLGLGPDCKVAQSAPTSKRS